jgi:uncharacterized repeat protein (TIGR01451 family)
MKQNNIASLVLVAFLILWAGPAFSADPGFLELKTVAQKEIVIQSKDGKKITQIVPAGKVIPGDEVIYTIEYKNISQKTADNVFVTDPIPQEMIYRTGSARGEGTSVTFSIDGGVTYDVPENLKVTGEDGKPKIAGPEKYTHIRWKLDNPLPAGQSGQVMFRAELK